MKKSEDAAGQRALHGRGSTAFLLTQVGSQAAMRYAERLASLGLTPAQSGMLRAIGASAGVSQRELATLLSVVPSRLVVLVDELEERGLVERRDSEGDRRVYELYLSDEGRKALEGVGRVARAHDEAFLAPLTEDEQAELRSLLTRLADREGLTPGVHPGYRHLAGSREERAGGAPRLQAPDAKKRGKTRSDRADDGTRKPRRRA